MNVFAITRSLRAGLSDVALVRAIAELAPTDVTITIFNALGKLPLFSPGYKYRQTTEGHC